MKRIVAAILIFLIFLNSSTPVFAGPKLMPDGNIFDPEYYYSLYKNQLSSCKNEYELYYTYKKNKARYTFYDGYNNAGARLGKYNDANHFLDDMPTWDRYSYTVLQSDYILSFAKYDIACGPANLFIDPDKTAENLMKNEYKTRELLSDVIDNICETEINVGTGKKKVKAIDNLSKVLKLGAKIGTVEILKQGTDNNPIINEVIKGIGEDVIYDKEFKNAFDSMKVATQTVETLYSYSEDFQKIMTDYEHNIEILDAIEPIVKEGTLKVAIRNLKKTYKESFQNAASDIVSNSLKEFMTVAKAMDLGEFQVGNIGYADLLKLTLEDNDKLVTLNKIIAKQIIGKGFSTGTAIIDLIMYITGGTKKSGYVDKVLMSSYLRTDAIYTLRNAEEKFFKNPNDEKAFEQFYNSFLLAQGLTAIQYKNMYEYYKEAGKTELAEKNLSKLTEINEFTPAKYLDELSYELARNKGRVWRGAQEPDPGLEPYVNSSGDLSALLGRTLEEVMQTVPGGTVLSAEEWYDSYLYSLYYIREDMKYYILDGVEILLADDMVVCICLYKNNEYSIFDLKPFYSPSKVKNLLSSKGWSYDGVDNLNFEGCPPRDIHMYNNGSCIIDYEYAYEDEFNKFEGDRSALEYDHDPITNRPLLSSSISYFYDYVFE